MVKRKRKKPSGRPGAALFTPSGWEEVKNAYAMGVDDATLSVDFGVAQSTLRKRRSRDGQMGNPWVGPAQAKRAAEEERMKNKLRVIGNGTRDVPMTADQSVAQMMIKSGELATEHAMKVLLKKLTAAAMDPDKIADLEDVSDISTAVKTARNIAGLDRPEVAVAVSVGNMFPSE